MCVALNQRFPSNDVFGAHRATGISEITADMLPGRNTPRGGIDPASIVLALFVFSNGARLQSMRLMGDGEVQLESMTRLLEVS